MTAEQLRSLLKTQPFEPFTIHLGDGRNLRVQHPDLALITPNGRIAVVAEPDSTTHYIDLLLVTDLVPDRNGKPRRRARTSRSRN